jgi:hypothetical protein
MSAMHLKTTFPQGQYVCGQKINIDTYFDKGKVSVISELCALLTFTITNVA